MWWRLPTCPNGEDGLGTAGETPELPKKAASRFLDQPHSNSDWITPLSSCCVVSRLVEYSGQRVQHNRQRKHRAGEQDVAFDSAGNLWLTDPGNRRVLRFRAADVAKESAQSPR